MEQKVLQDLFEEITKVTKVKDVGYHRIAEGRLKPIYKTQTDILGIEKWKTVHEHNPVYIKDTYILREINDRKQPIEIYDIDNDTRSADAFFLFGIKSILIIPVIRQNKVKAIICIASIGELHKFTKEEMEKCCKLSDEYLRGFY